MRTLSYHPLSDGWTSSISSPLILPKPPSLSSPTIHGAQEQHHPPQFSFCFSRSNTPPHRTEQRRHHDRSTQPLAIPWSLGNNTGHRWGIYFQLHAPWGWSLGSTLQPAAASMVKCSSLIASPRAHHLKMFLFRRFTSSSLLLISLHVLIGGRYSWATPKHHPYNGALSPVWVLQLNCWIQGKDDNQRHSTSSNWSRCGRWIWKSHAHWTKV